MSAIPVMSLAPITSTQSAKAVRPARYKPGTHDWAKRVAVGSARLLQEFPGGSHRHQSRQLATLHGSSHRSRQTAFVAERIAPRL